MKRRHLLTALLALPLTLAAAETPKPVLLYSRYFNALGETRYQPDGNYKEVLTRLRGEFEVRIHAEPLNAKSLAGVNAVLIANPSDKAAGTNPRRTTSPRRTSPPSRSLSKAAAASSSSATKRLTTSRPPTSTVSSPSSASSSSTATPTSSFSPCPKRRPSSVG